MRSWECNGWKNLLFDSINSHCISKAYDKGNILASDKLKNPSYKHSSTLRRNIETDIGKEHLRKVYQKLSNNFFSEESPWR